MGFRAQSTNFLHSGKRGKPPFLKVKQKNKKNYILFVVYESEKLYIDTETRKQTQYIVFFDKNRSLCNV